jgi:hypothetical protein
MTHINFDGVARRDAKEPQITKAQLLESPHHATSGTGWDTPRSIYEVGDLVANGASWDFGPLDALDTTETPSDSSKAPIKQELATPAPDFAQYKGQYESDDENNQTTARKQNSHSCGTKGRQGTGSSSEDKFGHKSGVIDLTGEDSDDDEQDLAMPERRFVPRAELDNAASSFPRQKTASPPRTFTKGLEPIAAHPRKPPIVHRQKPPIKPAGRQRKTVSVSPSPAVAAHQTVFTKRRRLLSSQPADFQLPRSSSAVRTLECTPLGYSTDSTDQTPGREVNPNEETNAMPETTPTPSGPKNPCGPFLEEDDSSDDTGEKAAPPKKKYSRDSVTRLLDRPRNDTPIRSAYNVMVEQSRVMRARAHQRAQEDLATRANTVAPGADNADVDTIDEQAFLGLPHRREMP